MGDVQTAGWYNRTTGNILTLLLLLLGPPLERKERKKINEVTQCTFYQLQNVQDPPGPREASGVNFAKRGNFPDRAIMRNF